MKKVILSVLVLASLSTKAQMYRNNSDTAIIGQDTIYYQKGGILIKPVIVNSPLVPEISTLFSPIKVIVAPWMASFFKLSWSKPLIVEVWATDSFEINKANVIMEIRVVLFIMQNTACNIKFILI